MPHHVKICSDLWKTCKLIYKVHQITKLRNIKLIFPKIENNFKTKQKR